jgi:hypothetical protein
MCISESVQFSWRNLVEKVDTKEFDLTHCGLAVYAGSGELKGMGEYVVR